VLAQVTILAVTSVLIEFFVLLAYGPLAGRLTELTKRPPFARLANRIAGSMLIGADIGMATRCEAACEAHHPMSGPRE
jgi:homoserine/homoserine lactone efflux protein